MTATTGDERQAVRICVFVAALDDGHDLDGRVTRAVDQAVLTFQAAGLDLMYDEEAAGRLGDLYGPIGEVEARLLAADDEEEEDAITCPHCEADLGEVGFWDDRVAEVSYLYHLDGEKSITDGFDVCDVEVMESKAIRCGQCHDVLPAALAERLLATEE